MKVIRSTGVFCDKSRNIIFILSCLTARSIYVIHLEVDSYTEVAGFSFFM